MNYGNEYQMNKNEIKEENKFEIFFLKILFNNPKFIFFLLKENSQNIDNSNKYRLIFKDIAQKLINESEDKKDVNPFDSILKFIPYHYYPNYFLHSILAINLGSVEIQLIIKSIIVIELLPYNNLEYIIPFFTIFDYCLGNSNYSIEKCLKKNLESQFSNKLNIKSYPEILHIFISRVYYSKISLKETLDFKEVNSFYKSKYQLIGIICKDECFYKNFFDDKWYNYKKNKENIKLRTSDKFIYKNLPFYLLIYKKEGINYSKEIYELKEEKQKKKNFEIPHITGQINSFNQNGRQNEINQTDRPIDNICYSNYGKVGLKNIGSTCFMNSVLQCVKNLYQLTYYFLCKEGYKKEITKIYTNLLINLCQKNIASISPRELKVAIGKKDDDFLDYSPNDSKEFLMLLLNCLGSENPLIFKNENFEGFLYKNEDKEKFEKAIKKESFSEISLLYNFALKTTFSCNACKRSSKNFQFYNILDLPIISENGTPIESLVDAIQNFEKEKKNKCSCGSSYMKSKTVIYTLPEIFIIHLQRSNLRGHSTHFVNFKNEISFNEKLLSELNPKYRDNNYELVGVINHHGSQNGGHNFSYCKNFFDNNWYEYNDDDVSPIKESYICTRNGFLLFYQLKKYDKKKSIKIEKIVEIIDNKKTKINKNYEHF